MKRLTALTVAVLAATTLTASAAPIAPGGWIQYPAPEPGPELLGALQIDQIVTPYAGADIQGWLVSSVYDLDPANPFGLTFTYQVLTDVASTHPIETFTVGNYGFFSTDVSWDFAAPVPQPPAPLPFLTVPPVYVGRSITGDVISFDFGLFGAPGIFPGEGSEILTVRTDARDYQHTIASVINSGSAEVLSFAPIAVPEPASIGLIALFTGGLCFVRRFFID